MVNIENIPNIIKFITSGCDVQSDVIESLASLLIPCRFEKRELVVEEGTVRGKAYFIEKGMTRSYWMWDGNEITTSFSTEGSVVFSMDEVYYGKPSEEYVEAVEPIEAYAIPIADLHSFIEKNIDMAVWWGKIHQDEYRRLHRSHKERLTLPAAERYEAFERAHPDVCRRARLTDIASYLGISLSTLSRIRRRRSQ